MTLLYSHPRLLYSIYLLILTVLLVATAEGILRARGVEPWQKEGVSLQVDPGGKLFKRHPTLGYSHIPGNFTVTKRTGYSFKVTHLRNTLRITRPIDMSEKFKKNEKIWIFGCSFTHGWSLNDEETYPWLLQRQFPRYDVVNFGVSGYGTIHSLLQFRDTLKTTTPKVAILSYATSHDARNTFSRIRRKRVARVYNFGPLLQPYARLDKRGNLRYSFADIEYREFPMMRHMALAHFIEMKLNQFEHKRIRSQDVSRALIMEMATLAKEHEVDFVIAKISGGRAMLDFAKKNGIPNVDISLNLDVPENTNRPHDGHPSAIANQKYADKLGKFLRERL